MNNDNEKIDDDLTEVIVPESDSQKNNDWNKEPAVVEEIGNLRLAPEEAKRYREILKARQKSDGRSF